LLAERLHPSYVQSHVGVVSTETIMNLVKFYVNFLFDPIIVNLAKLKNELANRSFGSFYNALTTVSAFESLLAFTLFGGTTHS
jgi:hypothetical protein